MNKGENEFEGGGVTGVWISHHSHQRRCCGKDTPNEFKGGSVWISRCPYWRRHCIKNHPKTSLKGAVVCGYHTTPHQWCRCRKDTPNKFKGGSVWISRCPYQRCHHIKNHPKTSLKGRHVDLTPPPWTMPLQEGYTSQWGGFKEVEGTACGYHTAPSLILRKRRG